MQDFNTAPVVTQKYDQKRFHDCQWFSKHLPDWKYHDISCIFSPEGTEHLFWGCSFYAPSHDSNVKRTFKLYYRYQHEHSRRLMYNNPCFCIINWIVLRVSVKTWAVKEEKNSCQFCGMNHYNVVSKALLQFIMLLQRTRDVDNVLLRLLCMR